MGFSLDAFVSAARWASTVTDISALEALLQTTVADPSVVRAAIPNEVSVHVTAFLQPRLTLSAQGPDEVLLHQDEDCTVYIVRVMPGMVYPPHDHGMAAVIGVFEGPPAPAIWELTRSPRRRAGSESHLPTGRGPPSHTARCYCSYCAVGGALQGGLHCSAIQGIEAGGCLTLDATAVSPGQGWGLRVVAACGVGLEGSCCLWAGPWHQR
jgi:hypothetical protein